MEENAAQDGATARKLVLFVSTSDASRGQMAEVFLRQQAGDIYEAFSAGVEAAAEVHPLAIEVMREVGLDISGHKPISLSEFLSTHQDASLDKLIILSETAYELDAQLPEATDRYYWIFDNPAHVQGDHEKQLYHFRRVREELKVRICLWREVECRPESA